MIYFLAGLLIVSASFQVTNCSNPKNLEYLYPDSTVIIKYQDDYQVGEFHKRIKEFKNDPLGHLAKFKNAQVYYFSGEYDWCQAQLDVLKASTSKLIANDALELSVLITDNYNMDTSETAMKLFAIFFEMLFIFLTSSLYGQNLVENFENNQEIMK